MKFELDEMESKKYKEWNEQHLRLRHKGEEPYTGAIGGRVEFRICGTSLGQILTATCCVCERNDLRRRLMDAIEGHLPKVPTDQQLAEWHEVNLTDFDEW